MGKSLAENTENVPEEDDWAGLSKMDMVLFDNELSRLHKCVYCCRRKD